MNTRQYYLRLLRTFALATLTAAAVTACTDDNGDPAGREPITPADGIPVTFTANINPGSDADSAKTPDTRTVLTPTQEGGFTVEWKGQDTYADNCDKIELLAAKGTTKIGSKTYVPTISDASSALEPKDDQDPLTLPSEGEWQFTAVYGASQFINGVPSANLEPLWQSAPNSTDHIAKKDFSVATAMQHVDANSDMPQNISLRFEHKLSALQLHMKNETGEALIVKEIRLSASGEQMAYLRNYDVATGDWKATGEFKDDYLKLIIIASAELPSGGSTAQDFHMLLFPGYANTSMTITVITDRGEYTLTKSAPGTGFAAGHNYMTNITLKTSGLDETKETWTEYINNKADLIAFRERVNNGTTYQGKTVRLTANISLTGETWTPIGNDSKFFSGTFDGDGYHISNLNVDSRGKDYAGLFGYINGGKVRNLRVSGTVTTTASKAGGIAGYLSGSTVENCIFSGDVSSGGDVGGIAGYSASNSRIAGCHTKGKVAASYTNAGGIAGQNDGSTINGCYSEAEVRATNLMHGSTTGGIAGQNKTTSTITHCYATGKVSGKNTVGGIVGLNKNSTLTGCIALNPGLKRTEGTEIGFGRIAGNNQGTVTSCAAYDGMTFTDANGNIDATGEHGTALTAAECLTAATYTTTLGFPVADATTAGWAFDAAATWTYLPWNPAFASFYGIGEAEYKISVSTFTGGAN